MTYMAHGIGQFHNTLGCAYLFAFIATYPLVPVAGDMPFEEHYSFAHALNRSTIFLGLNGIPVPDELPLELVPLSYRDIDTFFYFQCKL